MNRLDEETRRERIEYAERMLQRLKTGPKQLESAYKLSNILSLQAEQRQVRAEQKKLEWQKRQDEDKQFLKQSIQWIEDQKHQIINIRKRSNEFNELSRKDAENQREQRKDLKQIRTEIEKMEIEKKTKQMENVLKNESEIETERKLNRQNADYLSMFNQQEKHNSEYFLTSKHLML